MTASNLMCCGVLGMVRIVFVLLLNWMCCNLLLFYMPPLLLLLRAPHLPLNECLCSLSQLPAVALKYLHVTPLVLLWPSRYRPLRFESVHQLYHQAPLQPTTQLPPLALSLSLSWVENCMPLTFVRCLLSCCPLLPLSPVLVPSNSESVVAARISHMKVVIASKLGMACKVSEVNSQLSLHWHFSQTSYLFQAQPILSLHVSETILTFCPPLVEVLRPIMSSLKHGPSPSIVHVTPNTEGLPTPWVYGVHSWPSAALVIGLLAVKGEGVQVRTADCMCRKSI